MCHISTWRNSTSLKPTFRDNVGRLAHRTVKEPSHILSPEYESIHSWRDLSCRYKHDLDVLSFFQTSTALLNKQHAQSRISSTTFLSCFCSCLLLYVKVFYLVLFDLLFSILIYMRYSTILEYLAILMVPIFLFLVWRCLSTLSIFMHIVTFCYSVILLFWCNTQSKAMCNLWKNNFLSSEGITRHVSVYAVLFYSFPKLLLIVLIVTLMCHLCPKWHCNSKVYPRLFP